MATSKVHAKNTTFGTIEELKAEVERLTKALERVTKKLEDMGQQMQDDFTATW